MPRRKIIRTSESLYHIYNRSNNKEQFYLPLNTLWAIFIEQINILNAKYGCEVFAFVLMPNHYHLLVGTPLLNISESMLEFHRNIAKSANKEAGRINHFFGSRYQWCLVSNDHYFQVCKKYIYRNPVKARLCNRVEDYKYSTLTQNREILINESTETEPLNWLNTPFLSEFDSAIERTLKRSNFKPSRRNRSGFSL